LRYQPDFVEVCMRSNLLAVVAILGVATLGAHAQNQKQFQVYASVVDATGAPVTTLQPSDVRITENGVEAKVVKVEPVNWPTKVQVLVDNGLGLGAANISHLRNGIRGLLESLPENVEVALVTTAPQPRFLVRSTADRAAVLKSLDLLAPDSGAGRFVESLSEATQRIERDKADYFPAIVMVGTTAGDLNVRDSDVERLMKRLEQRPATVHVILLAGQAGQSSSAGANQTQVGLAVTKFTQGRYENINAPARLEALLPEIGAQLAKSHETQSHQFRLTVERPAGATGDVEKISMGAKSGLATKSLSFDGRVP
jgi:hypothetical protein